MRGGAAEPLLCPRCASTYPLSERFCPRCGMPLAYAGPAEGAQEPPSARRERARKIKPQYAEGDLVRVAGGRNQAEAELIQGLLLEEGVPSMLRRTAGFDVPDFLAAGPRDVLVPASGAGAAREVLMEADIPAAGQPAPPVRAARVVAALVAALAVVALAAWLGTELVR